MRMSQRLACSCLCLTILGSCATWAQESGEASADRILREYRAQLPVLIERYSTNRKIRFRTTRYDRGELPGHRPGDVMYTGVGEVITDGRQVKMVSPKNIPFRLDEVARLWRPDMCFNVILKGATFKITDQCPASSNSYVHESARYPLKAHLPLLSGYGGTTLWFSDRNRTTVINTVVGVKETVWKGRPCVEVRAQWDNRHKLVIGYSTYLDPSRGYISLGGESDWRTFPETKTTEKLLLEIEYGPSPEGHPLPKFERRFVQYQGGDTRKVLEVEVLSYERYVPAPEEFELEKPYGLTTPAVVPLVAETPPGPPPPDRRWWPWAILVTDIIVVIVVWLWCSRGRPHAANRSPSHPNPTTN
jgi:hypothetical protein